MKTALMFLSGKEKKTNKTPKIAAYFSSHNASVKRKKGALTFMYLLLKFCSLEQVSFEAFPY